MSEKKPEWPRPIDSLMDGSSGLPEQSAVARDSVDMALASLRNAEIPIGLEQRVLRVIERRQAHAATRPRRWFFPALAALATLILLVVGISHKHRQPNHIARLDTISVPQLHSPVLSGGSPKTQRFHPAQHKVESAEIKIRTLVATKAAVSEAVPPQAEEDRPAPELPLTRQERLLIRIAYGPQPQQQVALLHRNGMRLRPPAEDDFDFDAFFEPYTTPLTQDPQGDPK